MPLTLVADQLTVTRGARAIIDRLSFRVAAGEALVLTGPNGSGKTTLLRAVAGLLPTVSGSVHLDGGTAESTVGEQCHFVGHASAVKSKLTAAENIRFWCDVLGPVGGGPRPSIAAILGAFGLADLGSIPADYLSAGQRRRLGLARLLAAPRPLWLLDEPATSLDAASIAALTTVIDRHLEAGNIAIIATHQSLAIARARVLDLTRREAAA